MLPSPYPTLTVPSRPGPPGRGLRWHFRSVLHVDAPLLEQTPVAQHWALRRGDQWTPVQGKWIGRPSPAGRMLCIDAVTDCGGPMALMPCPNPPTLDQPVVIRDSSAGTTLTSGNVTVTATPDDNPQLTAFGRTCCPVLRYASAGRSFASDAGERRVSLCESGPIRAAVEVSGRCLNDAAQPGLSYRLRFDLFAGLPAAVVRVWFLHELPDVATLPVEQLVLTWHMPPMPEHHVVQTQHGLSGKPRFVTTDKPLRAAVGHDGATAWRLLDAAPLNDPTAYPPSMMPPSDQVSLWFAASDEQTWVAAAMDDVREMLPKGMALSPNELSMELWPDWAGVMPMPQGRSRSVTARLAFGTNTAPLDRQTVEAVLASTSSEPVLADWPSHATNGFFDQGALLPHGAPDAQRFDDYLAKVACPPTVADMFHLGDTPDPGYQTTYLSTGRRLRPIVPPAQLQPIQFLAGGHFAAAPWSDLSQYEQVWTNNEYDVIWCMACETLRARRPDLLRPLRWYARHAIEVDFVHYSDYRWKHRCTPAHSAEHTFANAYPSHLWTEGVLAYYLLTGDEDALAFARAIGDKIIEFFSDPMQVDKLWNPTRELGWALLATAALAAVDDDPRYEQISRRIADELVAAPLDEAYVAQMVQYSFGFASLMLGLDRWHQVCPDERYHQWLAAAGRKCATQAGRTPSVAPSMTLAILYLGYKHSGDAQLLRAGMRVLEQLMDSPWWHQPPPYAKPMAMLHRPLARFFEAARREKLIQRLDYRFPTEE